MRRHVAWLPHVFVPSAFAVVLGLALTVARGDREPRHPAVTSLARAAGQAPTGRTVGWSS